MSKAQDPRCRKGNRKKKESVKKNKKQKNRRRTLSRDPCSFHIQRVHISPQTSSPLLSQKGILKRQSCRPEDFCSGSGFPGDEIMMEFQHSFTRLREVPPCFHPKRKENKGTHIWGGSKPTTVSSRGVRTLCPAGAPLLPSKGCSRAPGGSHSQHLCSPPTEPFPTVRC